MRRPERFGSRDRLYALTTQAMLSGYGLLVLLLGTRLLTSAELGQWILFSTVIALSEMLMHGLLQTIVVRDTLHTFQEGRNTSPIVFNSLALALLSGFILLLFFEAGSSVAIRFGADAGLAKNLRTWFPFLFPFMALYNVFWWRNTGLSDFKKVFLQRFLYVVTAVLVLGGLYFFRRGLDFAVFAAAQLSGLAAGTLFGLFSSRITWSEFQLSQAVLRKYIAYGKYTIGSMLAGSLLRSVDTLMIAAMMNPAMVALYAVAQKLTEMFEVVLRSSAAVALVNFTSGIRNATLSRLQVEQSVRKLTFSFLPVALLIASFPERILLLLTGSDEYAAAAPVLQIFMIYVVLLPADRFLGVLLEANGLPQLNLIKTLIILACNVLVNYLAIRWMNSLSGVAGAGCLALLAGIITGAFFLRQRSLLPLKVSGIEP